MSPVSHAMMMSRAASGHFLGYHRKRLTHFMDSAALQQCDVIRAPFKANIRDSTEGGLSLFCFCFLFCGEFCRNLLISTKKETERAKEVAGERHGVGCL